MMENVGYKYLSKSGFPDYHSKPDRRYVLQ